jgi:hypothetical protein
MAIAYQILALDPSLKTRSEDCRSLLYQIRGFSKLWSKTAKIHDSDDKIIDGSCSLLIVAATPDEVTDDATDRGRAFILTLTGTYEQLEPKREPLAALLKDASFDLIYVLKDEVSEHVAIKLYPLLYRIENLLRGYLIRFMATRIGPRWWELSASAQMTEKARMRKGNERVFGKLIENSAYLIDFDELGELVYKQSSGYLTREDIVGKVTQLVETPEAIRALKQELRTNYDKLFKEAFADKGFKDKWKQFESLRNKIAHNNLFTAADLATGEQLAHDLTAIITSADAEAQKLVITADEREAIKEQVAKAATWQTRDLTDESFFKELDVALAGAAAKGLFVGLTWFTNNVLIPKGFSYLACHSTIERLTEHGTLEVYYVPHPNEPAKNTAALRRPQTKT